MQSDCARRREPFAVRGQDDTLVECLKIILLAFEESAKIGFDAGSLDLAETFGVESAFGAHVLKQADEKMPNCSLVQIHAEGLFE